MLFFRLANRIPAMGVLVGAASLLAACGPSPDSTNRTVSIESAAAVMVNGEPIYLTDVTLEAIAQGRIEPGAAFSPDHPEFQPVLDQLVDQKLLAQQALNLGLDQQGDAQRRLAAGRERLLGNILVEHLVAREVTEEAIDEMYSQQVKLQQLNDQVRLRHILLDTEMHARDLASQLDQGADFTDLAFVHSKDLRTRGDGGSFGWVSPNDMAPPFPERIGNTPTGALSDVFQSEQGWHILRVDERRTRPPMTKDQMRPELITFLTLSQISDVLRDLRASAAIDQRRLADSSGRDPADTATSEETEPANPQSSSMQARPQ